MFFILKIAIGIVIGGISGAIAGAIMKSSGGTIKKTMITSIAGACIIIAIGRKLIK